MQFFIGIPNLQSELLISSRKNLQMFKVKWSEQVMIKEQAKGYGQILSFFCLLEPYPDLTYLPYHAVNKRDSKSAVRIVPSLLEQSYGSSKRNGQSKSQSNRVHKDFLCYAMKVN